MLCNIKGPWASQTSTQVSVLPCQKNYFFEHKLLKTKCLRLGHLSSEHCWTCHSALKQPQHSSAFNNNVMSAIANDNADSNRSYAYPMESHLHLGGQLHSITPDCENMQLQKACSQYNSKPEEQLDLCLQHPSSSLLEPFSA